VWADGSGLLLEPCERGPLVGVSVRETTRGRVSVGHLSGVSERDNSDVMWQVRLTVYFVMVVPKIVPM
jgi:hypothetical protein